MVYERQSIRNVMLLFIVQIDIGHVRSTEIIIF